MRLIKMADMTAVLACCCNNVTFAILKKSHILFDSHLKVWLVLTNPQEQKVAQLIMTFLLNHKI